MVGAIAAGLGYTVRALLALLRVLPGIVGPVVAVYGVWLLSRPAGYIAGGLVLWAADVVSSRPAPEPKQESA